MYVKTEDGMRNVASQGVGGAALGLAIPGTLAFLNQIGGIGGFFGGNDDFVLVFTFNFEHFPPIL